MHPTHTNAGRSCQAHGQFGPQPRQLPPAALALQRARALRLPARHPRQLRGLRRSRQPAGAARAAPGAHGRHERGLPRRLGGAPAGRGLHVRPPQPVARLRSVRRAHGALPAPQVWRRGHTGSSAPAPSTHQRRAAPCRHRQGRRGQDCRGSARAGPGRGGVGGGERRLARLGGRGQFLRVGPHAPPYSAAPAPYATSAAFL
mmetsp:Transcript_5657/g.17437  ORF Transcript_5657/g.17437 Transcript_5657/m.17437 type:complete len:202 (+) Transcript_5657:703-1308(+)